MVLGQSAGTAAAMAIDAEIDVQQVEYAKLRERLLKDGQILTWSGARPRGGIDLKKLEGVVVDDEDAKCDGFDAHSTAIGSFVHRGYRHDGGTKDGKQSATFTTKLPHHGNYEVRLWFSAHPNRATNVPVVIVHADGKADIRVNQRRSQQANQRYITLGTYRFEKDQPASVRVSNAGVDGHVVIDAVQWVPRPE